MSYMTSSCIHLFNFIMEAVIIGSRAINQDVFFQKEQDSKYSKHMNSIRTITN